MIYLLLPEEFAPLLLEPDDVPDEEPLVPLEEPEEPLVPAPLEPLVFAPDEVPEPLLVFAPELVPEPLEPLDPVPIPGAPVALLVFVSELLLYVLLRPGYVCEDEPPELLLRSLPAPPRF